MRLRFPLDQVKITQYFGERPEFYSPYRGHMGIDLRTKYPVADGETFKLLFGDYQNVLIHQVDILSKPVGEGQIRKN